MNKEIVKSEKGLTIKQENIIKQEWYQNLITDLQKLKYKENVNLIISKWEIGDRIEKETQKGRSFRGFVPHVEQDTGISQTEQWYCWKFRKQFPKLTEELKQQSWRRLSRNLDPFDKEKTSEYKLFDVWNFQSCDEKYGEPTYPGKIPGQIVKNILYYFTDKKDLIIDPMAGGGTTIDVCREMDRQCLAYDLVPFREDILKHDLSNGMPKGIEKCDLVFWDPPYWKKKENEYDKKSVSSLGRKEYLQFFDNLITEMGMKMKLNSKVAFLMSNYIDYENPKDSIFCIDYCNMFIRAGFTPLYEIQCPLSTQQYQAFQVSRAKENKQILIISRSLYIYGKI